MKTEKEINRKFNILLVKKIITANGKAGRWTRYDYGWFKALEWVLED